MPTSRVLVAARQKRPFQGPIELVSSEIPPYKNELDVGRVLRSVFLVGWEFRASFGHDTIFLVSGYLFGTAHLGLVGDQAGSIGNRSKAELLISKV